MEMKPLYIGGGGGPQGVGAQNGNSRPFIPSSSQRMMMPGKSRFGSYQPTRADKVVLVMALIFNSFLLVLAFGALFVGVFLNTYRGSYVDLCSDNEWFVAAGCMLAVGAILFIFVVFSFIATCYKSSRILLIFIFVLIFLFLGELAAGIYTFARRDYIEERFEACMTEAYQNEYKDPHFEHVTKAWDMFQDRFDCCGVQSSLDYQSNNKLIDNPPKTCGGTKADAIGKQPCFKVLRREVLDNFYIIGGAAVGLAMIQIIAILWNALLLRVFHKREGFE